MNLFMDSGAFSVFSSGSVIDIYQYIDFIKEHKEVITVYANLDVIGDAEATWRNQEIMEKHGLSPLPIYHLGDDSKYLDRCLDYDYMGVGGLAGRKASHTQRRFFLDRCFNKLCDPDGMPKIRVHGFGMTFVVLMRRYPWYSVDSKSWLDYSTYGHVIYPPEKNGDWCYSVNFNCARVSVRPYPTNKFSMVSNLNQPGKKLFDRYISEKGFVIGKSVMEGGEEVIIEPGLCNDHKLRNQLNAIYFVDFIKTLPKWPWAFQKNIKGFF